MRTTLLATVALCGFALALPAAAQTATPAPSPPGTDATGAPPDQVQPNSMTDQPAPTAVKPPHHARHVTAASSESGPWAHQPGTGQSGPASAKASNIDSADTRSAIAPHLPAPKAGNDADPARYLQDADRALQSHRTGEAQQALEMAETRLLDRSTPADNANQPDQNPAIQQVATARKALASGDVEGSRTAIHSALASAGQGGQ